MGPTRIPCAHALTAQDVLPLRHHLKMAGIRAATIAAEMVRLASFRDWANELLVGPMVRLDLPGSGPEQSVAVKERVSPYPAWPQLGAVLGDGTVLVDLRPEAL